MHQLGAWAFYQHNTICSTIYDLLDKEKINPIEQEFKDIRSCFNDTTFNLSQNNGISITDTFIFAKKDKFYSIFIDKNICRVIVKAGQKEISLDKSPYQFLNREQQLYICLYSVKGVVKLNDIPELSEKILGNTSIKLYHDAMASNVKLYTNDSLKQTINDSIKPLLGYKTYLRFLDWRVTLQIDEPTVGYDTEYIEPYWIVIDSLEDYTALSYQLILINGRLEIKALGFGLSYYDGNEKKITWGPLGYIKVEDYKSADDIELEVIGILIGWILYGQLESYYKDMTNYMDHFKIKKKDILSISPKDIEQIKNQEESEKP